MTSLPPVAGAPAPAPPPVQQSPQQAVMWIYADQARTHEVQVGLRRGAQMEFFVRERAIGHDHPEDVLEVGHAMEHAWESRVHHLALEERLTLLGGYFRHTVGPNAGWTPVRRPGAVRRLQLEPLACEGLPAGAQFHYYGSRTSTTSTMLVTIPRATPQGTRHALARLDLLFPQAEKGRLTLVHARLPDVLLRSALAAQDHDLASRGMEKLPSVDRKAAANEAWCRDLDSCAAVVLDRIAHGRFGGQAPLALPTRREDIEGGGASGGAPAPTPAPSAGALAAGAGVIGRGTARVIAIGAEPRRLAPPPKGWKMPARLLTDETPYEIEYEEPAPTGPRAGEEAAKIEEHTLDFGAALRHPRVLALHAEYLAPGEEAALFAEGELAIRAAMKQKRAAAPHDRQHVLSILEASLLIRYALVPGSDRRVDPQAADLLKRSLVYLGR